MTQPLVPGTYTGTVLLADISGFTNFLESVRAAHEIDTNAPKSVPVAYSLMSRLLNGIAELMDPPMTFVKFEGDAVFVVATHDATPSGQAMLDCIQTCYAVFVDRLNEAGVVFTCSCGACGRKTNLDLKFVVHHGEYFVQEIGSQVDALGPDVTIAHRLLKNSASQHLGSAYALFTNAAVEALHLPLTEPMAITEQIEGMRPVGVQVVPLMV